MKKESQEKKTEKVEYQNVVGGQNGGVDGNLAATAIERNKIIIRTSIIGIVANVFLVAFKAVVGILTHSIAVILDAVNNLTDALSSVITIVGTKLAGKMPDKKHPMGYGRIEYLSAMIVSALVLYAGLTSLVESIKKIIKPEKVDYSIASLIIIAAAVLVKFFLGKYVKRVGKKVNSSSLVASGADAQNDAFLSASVFASAIIFYFTKVSLEAYVGVVISVFIIKAGIEMMIDTLNDILGRRTDKELSARIKELIKEEDEVRGAYDLIVNNYGPNKNYASVHIEIPDTLTANDIDLLERRLQIKVFKETGVVLTGIGIYSYNTKSDEAAIIRDAVKEKILSHEWAIQVHGFYIDTVNKEMRFDVVLSFDIETSKGLTIINEDIKELYGDYRVLAVPDVDFSD
ncbi:MAG TPA: cation transporter [Lachnospiraceae bacterium]|nr:cation transporter [Lachnospiraceae bacterium]